MLSVNVFTDSAMSLYSKTNYFHFKNWNLSISCGFHGKSLDETFPVRVLTKYVFTKNM